MSHTLPLLELSISRQPLNFSSEPSELTSRKPTALFREVFSLPLFNHPFFYVSWEKYMLTSSTAKITFPQHSPTYCQYYIITQIRRCLL